MKRIATLLLLLSICTLLTAQSFQESGSGAYYFEHEDCITPEERQRIQTMIDKNVERLAQEGNLPTINPSSIVLLEWPVAQADGFNYNSFYGISNFVDHDPVFSGDNNDNITDYECGGRSYDTGSGYNHTGIDIFTWPFAWHMLDKEQVEVVAAAPGVIIGKDDGSYDRNCTFNSSPWNAVYIMHEDGSTAWYGHVKNGSLTTKAVGESVEAGEYLAVLASSGNSTGPHLHFELYDGDGDLVDPYMGDCNPLNSESWWLEQKPYYEPTINTLLTGVAPPNFNFDCPTAHASLTNFSNCFSIGDPVFFQAYYHDQLQGMVSEHVVYDANGDVVTNWNNSSNVYYSASFWWNTNTIPANAVPGQWRYEVTFNGQTVSQDFYVTEEGLSPTMEPAALSVTGCELDGVVLTAGGGDGYLWSTGETTPSIEVTASGVYYVTITAGENCYALSNRTVDLIPGPSLLAISGNEEPMANTVEQYNAFPPSAASYEWTVVGGTIIEATAQMVTVEWDNIESGQLCVQAFNADGCPSEQLCDEIIIQTISSTKEVPGLQSLNYFPNPFKESIIIDFTLEKSTNNVSLSLANSVGQVVASSSLQNLTAGKHQEQFNLAQLPSGVYWLQTNVDGLARIDKVIKY